MSESYFQLLTLERMWKNLALNWNGSPDLLGVLTSIDAHTITILGVGEYFEPIVQEEVRCVCVSMAEPTREKKDLKPLVDYLRTQIAVDDPKMNLTNRRCSILRSGITARSFVIEAYPAYAKAARAADWSHYTELFDHLCISYETTITNFSKKHQIASIVAWIASEFAKAFRGVL